MFKNLNYFALFITALNLAASITFSYLLTPSLINNSDALNLVANVFSILSGFLLLVITMSGENSSISNNLSALDLSYQEARFTMRFHKYYALFLLYIATLALIFINYLLLKYSFEHNKFYFYTKTFIGYAISFLTCFSFIQSTFIPLKIKELFAEKRELGKK